MARNDDNKANGGGKTKTKKKRKRFSLKEKAAMIEEAMKPGLLQVEVAKKHEVSVSTLNGFMKDKDQILAAAATPSLHVKRVVKGKEHELEERLYSWFLKKRAQGLLLDRPLLRKKAEEMAKHMNLNTDLKFSSGWLFRWRKRFGIKFKVEHGEKQSADFEAGKKWIDEVLPCLLETYRPKDIYNTDETGVFFRGMARAGMVAAGEKPSGVKAAKDRLTVLVTCNMDGSDKKPLLVVGKAERPRKFPRDLSSLPVQYEHTRKAWMTGLLWTKFLRQWDRQARLQGRKLLLLADNAPSHCSVSDLTNIRVEFLPKNTTSLIQPCDAGIIKNFKGKKLLDSALVRHA